MLIKYDNRLVVPIVHEDGTLEARPYRWKGESTILNDALRFNPKRFNFLMVHSACRKLGNATRTKYADIILNLIDIQYWDSPSHLKEQLFRWLRKTYQVGHDFEITDIETEGATACFVQSNSPNWMTIGFDYKIVHNDDFDKDCMVCTESTEILHTILGEWLNEAIIVESDWQDQKYFEIKDTSKIIILPSNSKDEPIIARLLKWFCDNFDETIKLASVDKVTFCEYGLNIAYEQVIEYASVVERYTHQT